MIPTYNCAKYLRKTLESILDQDPGEKLMEIIVVDDCSTKDDPQQIVEKFGRGRVIFSQNETNTGCCTLNFNVCLRKSTGQWIHVLHGDDYVLPGFYRKIMDMMEQYPHAALLATRCVFVDERDCWLRLGPIIDGVDSLLRDSSAFHYNTPLQFAGLVVRRSFYEATGGFREDLIHTADLEMWERAVSEGGGVVSPEVRAAYRLFEQNDTGQLMRMAGNIKDRLRLTEIFASRIPGFDRSAAYKNLINLARSQHAKFLSRGDGEAVKANEEILKSLGCRPSWRRKILRSLKRVALPPGR